jgi:mn2+/fe2+ transporter, NRAMP family
MSSYKKVSLSEINQSIETPNNNHFWQNLKAFLGPGALVAVGYMDPGNWITSVVGGASYKYNLLFVILISSIIAMQLQQMAGRLGIVTRMDLAQATAYHAPCDYSCRFVWTSRKNLGSVIGLFTSLSFNRSSILNFPPNLFDI